MQTQVIILRGEASPAAVSRSRVSVDFARTWRVPAPLVAETDVVEAANEAEVQAVLAKSKHEAVHLVLAGYLVLPLFYQAVHLAIADRDYAWAATLGADYGAPGSNPTGLQALMAGRTEAISQFLVRRWVFAELAGMPLKDLYPKIAAEYAGNVVKSVLVCH